MSERLPRPAARRRDDGPSLFGADEPPPTDGPYARPGRAARGGGGGLSPGGPGPSAVAAPDRAALRPVVAELAAEVLAEADRRLSEAMRRAIGELTAGRPEAARAVLEAAIEEWGRAA